MGSVTLAADPTGAAWLRLVTTGSGPAPRWRTERPVEPADRTLFSFESGTDEWTIANPGDGGTVHRSTAFHTDGEHGLEVFTPQGGTWYGARPAEPFDLTGTSMLEGDVKAVPEAGTTGEIAAQTGPGWSWCQGSRRAWVNAGTSRTVPVTVDELDCPAEHDPDPARSTRCGSSATAATLRGRRPRRVRWRQRGRGHRCKAEPWTYFWSVQPKVCRLSPKVLPSSHKPSICLNRKFTEALTFTQSCVEVALPSLSRLAAFVTIVALAVFGTVVPASAAPRQWAVSEGSVSALLSLVDGTVRLAVSREGRTVLAPAPVGLRTAGGDLSAGLEVVGQRRRTVVERYEMTTGKRLLRHNRMSELRLELRGAGGARLDLVVRAAADGVAYRYELPAEAVITGEASAFSLPAGAPAWLLPYNAWYEQNRVATTAGEATGDFGYPSLFQVGGDFALLTESDVDGRYSGSRLRHAAGATDYQVVLADAQVTAKRTPWRTAIVGDLATVTESTLVDDLATPSKLRDTSWIRPGKVAWSWLSDHPSPSDFQRQKDFVDFAARNNWYAVLVDEGWSAEWVPELVRYARARGVEIILWFHWNRLDTAEERDTTLPLVKSWGVRGVKLDFMESDTQARYQWYDAVLARTAELRLMVNFHGSTIPHGLARTWPHIMTMEAVRGAENYPLPVNNPVQAFTRNVVGSMDYTPVSLDTGIRRASVAHEVALPVVYESGWQHFADMPEAYERHPEALRYLNQVPTTWDETRLVAGHPSEGAVFARRSGERWFLGAISAGPARTMTAPLGFLGGGRWLVEIVRDGAGPRGDVVRSTQVRSARDTLSVAVPADGGFAALVCRAHPGRTTCDEPLRHVPTSTLDVTPSGEVDAVKGGSFEVTASFRADRDVRGLRLAPVAPAGWRVSGAAVTRRHLPAGQSVTGRWTVHVGQDTAVGYVDVPVVATFDAPQWPDPVHVERAVRAFVPPPPLSGTPYVSDLPFVTETNGWGPVERDRSVNESGGGDGNPLTIGGVVYEKGLGTHAPANVTVHLGGRCTEFTALLGLDDEITQPGSVVFQVVGDDVTRYDSGVLRPGPAVPVTVDVTGVRMLSLRVTDGGDNKNFDHADWAEARLTC